MNFGESGRKIINRNQFDYGREATINEGRLLVGNSDRQWYIPNITAINNEGDQDFTFGNGGNLSIDFNTWPEVKSSKIVYAEDGIYLGYKARPDDYRAAIQKYSYEGQPVPSFGADGILETVLTTHSQFMWVDAFSGIKQWGDDIVWLGAYLDTLCIVKVHPNGSYDSAFDNDGIVRCRVQSYLGEGNNYEINSWFIVNNKLYVSFSYHHWADGLIHNKILPFNSDGSVDTTGIIEVTSLNANHFISNGETI